MTDEERYLQEEEEYQRVRAMPFWERTKWFVRQAKADRDGSYKYNLTIFALLVGMGIMYFSLERIFR